MDITEKREQEKTSLKRIEDSFSKIVVVKVFEGYLSARSKIVEYRTRLQDAPMFHVLTHKDVFKGYLIS